MRLDNLLDNSQAQSGAAGGTGAGGVGAIEALKEIGEMFGCNAVPGILYTDGNLLSAGVSSEIDLSMAGSMCNSIAEQVTENLSNSFLVGFDKGQIGRNMHMQRQVFASQVWLDDLDRLAGNFLQ